MVVEFYYHAQSPPSCVVWMILKELEIDHKKIEIDLLKQEHKGEAFAKINPSKQVPAIRDGDLTLSQSRSIAIYLCTKYEKADKKQKLYPRDPEDIWKFHESLFRDLDNYNVISRYMNGEAIFTGRAKGPEEHLLPKCENILAELDNTVKDRTYMFGSHLTFLDFTSAFTIFGMEMTGYKEWEKYPNLQKWKENMSKLPYYEECAAQPTQANVQFYTLLVEKGPEVLMQMAEQPKK